MCTYIYIYIIYIYIYMYTLAEYCLKSRIRRNRSPFRSEHTGRLKPVIASVEPHQFDDVSYQ